MANTAATFSPSALRSPPLRLLIAFSIVGPLTIHLIMPSLPYLQDSFAADYASVLLLISVYVVAFGVAQLVIGPLADLLSRKPVLPVVANWGFNCVGPGLVETRLTEINESVVADVAVVRQRQIDTVPLGRAGSAEDVANVIAFLLTDDAAYVSGVLIPVDGASLVDHSRAWSIASLQKEGKARA